jgi:lipopolysaccharide transport system ATP-binding protein
MGMTKPEIARKLDEIVTFAGIEKYIDTPSKRYSSGMIVRLGFAIAAHLDPEILVVDEVLAVGDAEFQKKAIGKMQDVSKGEGRTVLFVSHNMGAVRNLCKTGVVLKNGSVAYSGMVKDAVDYYLENNAENINVVFVNLEPETTDIKKMELSNNNNDSKNVFCFEESITVNFDITIKEEYISSLYLGVGVVDRQERKIFNKNIPLKDFINKGGNYRLQMIIPHFFLVPNHYIVSAGLHIPNQKFVGTRSCAASFIVEDTGDQYFMYQGVDLGCVNANCEWKIIKGII